MTGQILPHRLFLKVKWLLCQHSVWQYNALSSTTVIYNLHTIIKTKDWITEAVCFHFAHHSKKYDIARYM